MSSSGHHTWARLDLERYGLLGVLSAANAVPAPVALLFSTAATVAGALVALAYSYLSNGQDHAGAAGLGALGAIAANLVVLAGVVGLRRTRAASLSELIEAASPVHPLMRRLMTEAPGTYVHSLATANIAEAAAVAVGADSLLTRVGAYYHDIGKLAQPCYFCENQDDVTPHDPSDPARSACIIMAHVEDGVVLARSEGLPARVIDIIREHHGTSLVRYFYSKASSGDAVASEADFRYRGERPLSKEAAIVMLADSSEASVRAMEKADPHRVEASVRSVIAERHSDCQLQESGLTENDLERIAEVFTKQLVHFRHIRCPYPAHHNDVAGECQCR
jgi:putative nucleotidyltransferase with HDIG domain